VKGVRRRRAEVHAVLTGDVVKSRRLTVGRLGEARKTIAEAVHGFRAGRSEAFRGEPEFFRGDAWQLVLIEPRWALRVALLTQAKLRSKLNVDTRVSIGVGVAGYVDPKQVSLSTGEAFTLSGRALDAMTRNFDLTGALPDRAGAMALWLPVALRLCSGFVRRWTRRQAEIVGHALLLQNPEHELIARTLNPPVAKQTVTQSLAGAGWRPLADAMKAFESTNWARVAGAPAPRESTNDEP